MLMLCKVCLVAKMSLQNPVLAVGNLMVKPTLYPCVREYYRVHFRYLFAYSISVPIIYVDFNKHFYSE